MARNVVNCLLAMRSISSLPRFASRRNELAVTDPSGKAISAAFLSRSGVSGPITAAVDNAISLITDSARTSHYCFLPRAEVVRADSTLRSFIRVRMHLIISLFWLEAFFAASLVIQAFTSRGSRTTKAIAWSLRMILSPS
jgi:hypothetical protein